jgi:hypothetical protein
MICGLASYSARPLFRRAVVEIGLIGAHGFGLRGISPDLADKMPLRPKPCAQGGRPLADRKML